MAGCSAAASATKSLEHDKAPVLTMAWGDGLVSQWRQGGDIQAAPRWSDVFVQENY